MHSDTSIGSYIFRILKQTKDWHLSRNSLGFQYHFGTSETSNIMDWKTTMFLAFPLWDSTVINGQLIYIYSLYQFNFFRPPWLVYKFSEMVFEVLTIQITWRWVPWTQNLLLSFCPYDVVLCGNSFSEETQNGRLLTQNGRREPNTVQSTNTAKVELGEIMSFMLLTGTELLNKSCITKGHSSVGDSS